MEQALNVIDSITGGEEESLTTPYQNIYPTTTESSSGGSGGSGGSDGSGGTTAPPTTTTVSAIESEKGQEMLSDLLQIIERMTDIGNLPQVVTDEDMKLRMVS